MIQRILIKDFAVIENTEVEFEDGLNIITGETGAGKSIVIEAVSLALGSRADSTFVRHGKKKAIIQLQATLGDEEFIITREISAAGKNVCRLNGQLVTLAEITKLARRIADIHGQYDNQILLDPEQHLTLVDKYKQEIIQPLHDEFALAYDAYKKSKSELDSLLRSEAENARKADFYRFQAEEIADANLQPGEDQELADRIMMLENSEKIFQASETAYSALDGEGPSILNSLGIAQQSVDSISGYTTELGEISKRLGDVYYDLTDIADSLRSIRESLTFSPGELDTAIARQEQIDGLKKKYGQTIEEVIAFGEHLADELMKIDNFDEEHQRLETLVKEHKEALKAKAAALTEARRVSASELAAAIEEQLHDLNFQDARLSIKVDRAPAITALGADQCEIFISTNRGEPLKPLARVASGGEISRIMLAIKNITASHDDIPTMIFDEIDTGISGIAASVVGRKLKEIAGSHQIICITHLPQIAACGRNNYRIQKATSDSETFTSVEHLSAEETVNEISRLLAGETITESTLQSARELLERSK